VDKDGLALFVDIIRNRKEEIRGQEHRDCDPPAAWRACPHSRWENHNAMHLATMQQARHRSCKDCGEEGGEKEEGPLAMSPRLEAARFAAPCGVAVWGRP